MYNIFTDLPLSSSREVRRIYMYLTNSYETGIFQRQIYHNTQCTLTIHSEELNQFKEINTSKAYLL